jgi:hypothetical protein
VAEGGSETGDVIEWQRPLFLKACGISCDLGFIYCSIRGLAVGSFGNRTGLPATSCVSIPGPAARSKRRLQGTGRARGESGRGRVRDRRRHRMAAAIDLQGIWHNLFSRIHFLLDARTGGGFVSQPASKPVAPLSWAEPGSSGTRAGGAALLTCSQIFWDEPLIACVVPSPHQNPLDWVSA